MSRGDEFAKDAHTCVVHVCVFNTKGEMLIQQRQKDKKGWPEKDCHYGVTLTALLPDGSLRVTQEKYSAITK